MSKSSTHTHTDIQTHLPRTKWNFWGEKKQIVISVVKVLDIKVKALKLYTL